MATVKTIHRGADFAEYDAFSRALNPPMNEWAYPTAAGGGLLGNFGPPLDPVKTPHERITQHLESIRQTSFYKRVSKDLNYGEALRALQTRATQTKRSQYHAPGSEIALLRAFAMYFHFYEVQHTYAFENGYPTKPQFDEMLASSEQTLSLLRQFSGLYGKIEGYPLALQLVRTIKRMKFLQRTYRKTRVDADVRKKAFAQNVAVQLQREFGECAPVLFVPLCAIVGYSPSRSILQLLAKRAIEEESNLATLS